jgi:hypothetical protein
MEVASMKGLSAGDEIATDGAPVSEVCLEFAKDIDADLGKVLDAGCTPTLQQMSALMDNPLGNVAMLFTQVDVYKMENPTNGKNADKAVYTGIAQFPKSINEDWNLISRVVWTVPSMPLSQDKIDNFNPPPDYASDPGGGFNQPSGSPPAPLDLFSGRTTDFGDMYYVGLFAPKNPIELDNGAKALWGVGFDVGLPTATEDILGTGKWLLGPSALGVYLGPKWKVGGLLQQYYDVGGDDDRADVNMTNLQYLAYYSLDETTSIGAAPNIICNWEQEKDNRCTVPIGMGINKTVNFGKVPVRFGFEAFYNVVQPDDIVGSEWSYRFYVIPAAPSALFSWMK